MRDEHGQALIVVALAIVVLLGAISFALDWGYALTQRRVTQNEADAAALAVGKQLAMSVLVVNGTPAFGLHQEDAWCTAGTYIDANRSFRPSDGSSSFLLQFGDASSPTVWTTGAVAASCPPSGTLTAVPASTRYVRVTASQSYPTLLGAIVGQPTLDTQASARARLSGSPVPLSGPTWPMVRHYDPSDFDQSAACPPSSCDPTTIAPDTFWSPSATDVVYGNFKGLVDLSRYSTRFSSPTVPQLESDWDHSGSVAAGTPLLADKSGNCSAGWDTAGDEAPSQQDKQCSVPNWFYYAFGGTLSLSSAWSSSLPSGQEVPSNIGTRAAICAAPPPGEPTPSCTSPTVGDWVETAYGNVGQNESDNMRARIAQYGTWINAFSSKTVASGPNKGNLYGKALTILVYLWDCAESFSGSAPAGSQWTLITSRGQPDCSQLQASGNSPTPDRVHLFTVAPFTFYQGLVTTQAIQGYWGGTFGDPRLCQDCTLNALSNTAFLVPDD